MNRIIKYAFQKNCILYCELNIHLPILEAPNRWKCSDSRDSWFCFSPSVFFLAIETSRIRWQLIHFQHWHKEIHPFNLSCDSISNVSSIKKGCFLFFCVTYIQSWYGRIANMFILGFETKSNVLFKSVFQMTVSICVGLRYMSSLTSHEKCEWTLILKFLVFFFCLLWSYPLRLLWFVWESFHSVQKVVLCPLYANILGAPLKYEVGIVELEVCLRLTLDDIAHRSARGATRDSVFPVNLPPVRKRKCCHLGCQSQMCTCNMIQGGLGRYKKESGIRARRDKWENWLLNEWKFETLCIDWNWWNAACL